MPRAASPSSSSTFPSRRASKRRARPSRTTSFRDEHPYPECFVCGPDRDAGDGLRIFPGKVEDREVVASGWIPDESLPSRRGAIDGLITWSVLDCPTAFGAWLGGVPGLSVLAKLEGRLLDRVEIGVEHVAIGWPIVDERPQAVGRLRDLPRRRHALRLRPRTLDRAEGQRNHHRKDRDARQHADPGSTLTDSPTGKTPEGDGWFIVNVAEAQGMQTESFGAGTRFENMQHPFPEFGINVRVLQPGQPNGLYHREDAQEAFLVLSGEVTAIVEDQERTMRKGDLLYVPPRTAHIIVGAGDGPARGADGRHAQAARRAALPGRRGSRQARCVGNGADRRRVEGLRRCVGGHAVREAARSTGSAQPPIARDASTKRWTSRFERRPGGNSTTNEVVPSKRSFCQLVAPPG